MLVFFSIHHIGGSKMFTTKDQALKYLSQPTLTCLLCGQENIKYLTRHIKTKHQITPREYKLQFGIPLQASLVGQETLSKRQLNPGLSPQKQKEIVTKMRNARDPNKKPHITSTKHELYKRFDYTQVFKKLSYGISMREALNRTEGAPSYETFCRLIKKDEELKDNYYKAIYKLPYNLQAKMGIMSNQFLLDCLDLRDNLRYTNKKIAQVLGVSHTTVANTFKKEIKNAFN